MKEENIRKLDDEEIKLLLENINKIKYGSVTVFIQDGKIVQIEKNEKFRFKS